MLQIIPWSQGKSPAEGMALLGKWPLKEESEGKALGLGQKSSCSLHSGTPRSRSTHGVSCLGQRLSSLSSQWSKND